MGMSGLESEYQDSKSAIAWRNSAERETVVRRGQVEASGLRIQRTGVSTHRRRNARLDREGTLLRFGYHDDVFRHAHTEYKSFCARYRRELPSAFRSIARCGATTVPSEARRAKAVRFAQAATRIPDSGSKPKAVGPSHPGRS